MNHYPLLLWNIFNDYEVLWEFISVVIMFYDVLLFIYLWLLVWKVFVLLNDVHSCFCLRVAVS